jgi:lipopolysaccharide transport system ATP-binding protein
VIALRDVTLTFAARGARSLRDSLSSLAQRERPPEAGQVTALCGVTLEVARGERVGIIGFNGAGKTTMLKVMCGIYPPTEGRVTVEGDIACLFELATGFEMEATGWDNIRTRGLLLGLTVAELREREKEIAEFTELGAALDRPMKTYSSGMSMRVAFAVSTSIAPDVLLLDEVIATGDIRFQEKAQRRLDAMVERASILVLVSHNMEAVRRMCGRVVWLEQGRIRGDGRPDDVIRAYQTSST